MKAAHVTCLLVLLGSVRLHAADPTTDYTWDSPDKHYRAIWSVNRVRDFTSIKIVSLTDPTAHSLLEGGGDVPAADGPDPGLVGIWSPDSHRIAVYCVGKEQGRGFELGATFYELQPDKGPDSPARFDFVSNNAKASPVTLDTDITDRLASLQGNIGQMNYGAFTVPGIRWKPGQLAETDNQVDFTAETKDGKKFPYRAKWTVTNRLTDSGFEYADVSAISYTLLDAAGKEGAWQTLPVTDQDRLRIAVRLNQPDAVSALLSKGVDPNKDSTVNLAALAAEVNGAPELALLLKAGVDINRDPTGRSFSMDEAVVAADPVVLQEMLTGKPTGANASSLDLYGLLIESLPQIEGRAQEMGKASPVDEEAVFLRKLKLLTSAKFDVNAADVKTGLTPLMVAVQTRFSTNLIQPLLDAGADPYKKNASGKTAVDLAADSRQLPVLRLLDARHQYADLEKSYEIPANSVYVGTWGREDFAIRLSADGTGVLATLFPGIISWKEVGGVAQIEVRLPTSNQPKMVMKGTARLGADSDTLILTVDQLTNPQGQTLHREKSKLAH